jgi:hypothetical protein
MKKLFLISLLPLLIVSCKREKEIMFVKTQAYKDAETIATKVVKTQGVCSCDPSLPATWPSSCAPRNPAITAYMGSLSSVTKTLLRLNL